MSDASSRIWRLEPGSPETASAATACIASENLHYRGRNEAGATELTEINGNDSDVVSWEHDVVVALVSQTVVAVAWVTPRGGCLAIDPAGNRPGLRGELLAWIEHREAERRVAEFVVTVPAPIVPTVAALERAGYTRARSYIEMAIALDAGAEARPRPLPVGYRLARVDRDDARRLHALDQRAFAARPDFVAEPVEEYERRNFAAGRFAPGWSLGLTARDGELAASLLGAVRPGRDAGYVGLLAVDPDHRRCGLASALLRAAFAAMRRAGRPGAELHVASDNPGALAVYRNVGMTEQERIDHYTRPR